MRAEIWYPAFMFGLMFPPTTLGAIRGFDTVVLDLRGKTLSRYEWIRRFGDCTLVAVDTDRDRLLRLMHQHGETRCLTEWRTTLGEHAAWIGAAGPTPCTPMLCDSIDEPIRLEPGGSVACGTFVSNGSMPLDLWRWMLRMFSPFARGVYCSARHNGAVLAPDITNMTPFKAAWMEQRRLCAWSADPEARERISKGLADWQISIAFAQSLPETEAVRWPLDLTPKAVYPNSSPGVVPSASATAHILSNPTDTSPRSTRPM